MVKFMAKAEDAEIFKNVKQGIIHPVYLLFGQEEYFVTACVDAIVKKTVSSGFESFNLIKFFEKADINEIENAVEALPVMSQKKCVIVKDMELDKLSKGDMDKLLELVINPNESTVFIIYSTSIIYDIKKSAKLKKLAEQISKTGIVCEFGYKDKATLKRALCERAGKSSLALDMMTAEYLITRCSSSYAILINELDKVIAFVIGSDRNEITEGDINQCCVASIDSNSFDLAKAVMSKKYDRAFLLMDELFFQRMEALSILGALNMCFIDLYRAKVALGAGVSPEQVLADFNYPKNRSFAVKNSFRDVKSYSIEKLRRCISSLAQADIELKSSKLDDRLILERMLGNMMV